MLGIFPGISNLYAQEVVWDVDFGTIFDNREGESKVADAKTFFLTQLAPNIGLSLMDGEHTLEGGIVWTQPIGCEWDGYRLSPTLFYQYRKQNLQGFMGMFPRRRLYKQVPDYIWNDSSYYVQKNVRGAAIMNSGRHGYFQIVLDWRGMQTKRQREAFNIIGMGEWQKSPGAIFSLGGVMMLNHLARREGAGEDESVVDNLLYNPYIGIDFSQRLPSVDSLRINLGVLGSVTRDRIGENKWKLPAGLWIDAALRWRWLRVREEFYAGGALFPYYDKYGSVLAQGEPYFSSKLYSRTEVQGYILDKSFITLKASLDFHVTSSDFIFYQRLILNLYFDGSFGRRQR